MPRVRAVKPGKEVALRSYFMPGAPVVPPSALSQVIFAAPRADNQYRQRFGRGLSMDRIEQSLHSAYSGQMRDLTDIGRETIDADPHLASVLNKRFGAVACLPYEIVPAHGSGVDKDRAAFYAEVVRQQIASLKTFKQNLLQLAWALFDGRAVLEKHWGVVVGGQGVSDPKFGSASVVLSTLGWIHPRRISFGPRRELRIIDDNYGYSGSFSTAGFEIDSAPYKFIAWTPQLFAEYPEREGLAPRCLYWSFFKRFGARERLILVELFGKPWRILEVEEDSSASGDELREADDTVDALGAAYTARMPRGVKLTVVQPQRSAGQIHDEVITESDRQISKLVLGQTGTTDGVPSGLNNSQANVMQDEQLMILTRDAAGLSEIIETQLCDEIIAVNFGPEAVTHAPHFRLRSDLPADRKAELERLQLALDAGLEISLGEAYEVSGFRAPSREEPILRIDQPPTPELSPVPPAPRPVIAWPAGTSPEAGEQQPPTPEASPGPGAAEAPVAPVGAPDVGATTTVNESRAGEGRGPLMLPDGSPDPRGDLTIAEFQALVDSGAASAGDLGGEPAAPAQGGAATPAAPLKVQDTALNGSQVAALMEIVRAVVAGELPRETAKNMIVIAFSVSEADAGRLIDSIGEGFAPATPPGAAGRALATSPEVLALVFDKERFSRSEAAAWAAERGFDPVRAAETDD